MPRWLLPALALSLAVLVLAAARPVLFPAQYPHITKANFDRIELTMRREQVEAILGPPGDHRTGPTPLDDPLSLGFYPPVLSFAVRGGG